MAEEPRSEPADALRWVSALAAADWRRLYFWQHRAQFRGLLARCPLRQRYCTADPPVAYLRRVLERAGWLEGM